MINQRYPLAYADGCDDLSHSRRQAGGSVFYQFKKDVRRFESDNEYAQRFSDGFRQCETAQESMQRQIKTAIKQQELMEQRKK